MDNFDWVEDLKRLLGDAADYVPGVSSLDELARGDWGGAAAAPFASAGALLSLPQATVKENIGGTIAGVKALGSFLGNDPQESHRLLHQTGRETWEETVPYAPRPVQIAAELATDPLNFITGPMSMAGANAVRAGIPNAGRFGQAALPLVASGIEGFNLLNNTIPERVMGGVGRRLGTPLKGVLESRFPGVLDYSPRTRVRRTVQDLTGALDEKLSSRGLSFRGMVPAVIPDSRKSLAPIDSYEVPPFFDGGFDLGVPSAVKARGWESWQALRMSQPDIPGINAAGITPAQPGQATFMEGQRPGGYKGALDRIRGSLDQPLGFIPPPKGGYREPGQVRLDEDNLRHMANIGAAVMMDFDNEVSNQMFQPLRRAGEGMSRVRGAIGKEYGPGITPFIPASYEDMVAQYGKQLPDVRFLSSWGWPQGEVGTKRLDALQKQVDTGKKTLEESYDEIMGPGFRKGSPQITETAAGMGAGQLMADLGEPPAGANLDPWSGDFAPTELTSAGRAAVPETFTSQFAKNRESYDRYMTQLFGEIPAQELDVLRQMSIESLYDEFLNAAGPVSGGDKGATELLRRGPNVAKYTTEKGGSVDKFSKIGAIPGQDPADIGNRVEDVARYGGTTKRGQRPSNVKLNKAEYEDIQRQQGRTDKITWGAKEYERATGKKLVGGLNESRIREMVQAVGGTGFQDNPKGGWLPNTQRLLDWFDVSKDIMVGDSPAPEWYQAAVDEVMDIVGPGRYEDAMMLMEIMAVTSSGTGVEDNARNALRAFAEWKMGSDDFIRKQMGLTDEEVETLLNRGGRWSATRPTEKTVNPKTGKLSQHSKVIPQVGDELFMAAMNSNQKKEAGRLFETYVKRRMDEDLAREAYNPTQGGPKTNNFAGSFVIKLWQDAINHAVPEGPLRNRIQKALSDAATIYTVDRHDARLANLATGVTEMGAVAQREARLIAARKLPDVRPEDIQAGLWYYSKSRQGFLQVQRDDDMASMLRQAWNERKDPGVDAGIRAKLREEIPELSDSEIDLVADDLMRQEAVIAIVKEQLGGSEDIRRLLGERDAAAGVAAIGQDALGIISRAGRGVAPRRRVSTAVTELGDIAEAELNRIRGGGSVGNTWKWDGQEFVPENATSGFAVALDSAGTPVSTRKPKTSGRTIDNFMAKYADLLDEPGMADNIRFGVWEFDGPDAASFDLILVVPDETTAVALAKQFNQKAIFDIGGQQIIDTGGSGVPVPSTPEGIRQVVEDVFGQTKRQRDSFDEVRRRGVTFWEMDEVNPVSILQRRVIQPVMREMEERSSQVMKPNRYQGTAVGETDPVDFAAIGQDPMLSTQANTLLNQDIDGETYGVRMQKYFDEAEADVAVYQNSGVKWGADLSLEERIERAGDNEPLKDIIRKYDKEGVDIAYADPRSLTVARITRDVAKKEGVKTEEYSTMDLLRAAWGEQVLLTPKYLLGNLQGAWLQNAFGGTFRVGTPSEFLAAFKLERGGRNTIEREDILRNLVAYQIAKKWGFDDLPTYIQRGGIRSMTSSRGRASGSAMGELTAKVTHNRRVGRTVGKVFKAQADMSQAIETVVRGSLWSDTLDREMTAAMAVIEDSINAMAVRQGLDDFEFSILNTINPVPGGPSPKRLKDHLVSLGFVEGYAERAGRNFAEAKNIAEKVAKAEVDKRQFSYDRTNLDEFVGKFIPFHYWYSRGLKYYAEESLRHPVVITSYMRANQGIEDAQNDPGLSARQKGFLRIMGTPLGFSLLMNPDALMGVVRIFGIDSSYTPEGETEAGGVINWLKQRGLGLYPWVDGTLNLMGVYGDTFEPDLLGIRHKSLIGSAVNFMRSQLGMDPMSAPYQELMGQARYRISSMVSEFTPDWLAKPVLPKAGGSHTDATLDTVIESRIIARNPGLSNGELLEIMSDPENPEYIAAFQDAAAAGLITQLINITTPVNVRMREDSRDVRSAQVSTIYEAAKAAGVNPAEFRPSMADAEFATRYKNLTGKEWKPGDYEDAKSAADLVRATPEAKPFVIQQQQFHDLGTPEQQRIFERYTAIRDGREPKTMALDEATRREIASIWADKNGYQNVISDMYALRDSYEQAHVEFGQYRQWQDQMYNLKANLGGDLTEYRKQAIEQNPNAAQYFRTTLEYIRSNYPKGQWADQLEQRTISADAYQAITGKTQNRQDPAPVPGVVPMDTTLPTLGPAAEPQNQYGADWASPIGGTARAYGYYG